MQFILYGLGDALNGGQIFLPGGPRHPPLPGLFLAVALSACLSAVSLPARRELLLRAFRLDRIKPGNKHIVSA